jgi:alkylated DNA nucleotide flippase Atl1
MIGLFSSVFETLLYLPLGKVTTYGALAHAAGGIPSSPASITNILSKTPNQRTTPYRRIVYANGRVWLPYQRQGS